jgi:glycosyltransferase involved in cell wall biosynthesis
MNTFVSVIVCTYNNDKSIADCIDSILNQTYTNFELIIVNDGSTDKTNSIISSFSDPRIVYINLSENCGSIGKVRNLSIGHVKGEYIFFTDGDCRAKQDWIEKGLTAFSETKAQAIEGRLIYHKDGYRRTLADRHVYNETGGWWMTANMAYHKSVFDKFNFQPGNKREEDRELAIQILQTGEIPFVRDFIVYHQMVRSNIREYILQARLIDLDQKVMLIRKYNDKNDLATAKFRIFSPVFLAILVFPPLVLGEFFVGRVRRWDDLKLVPFIWVKAVYMRYLVWKTAITKRYFIL